MIKLCDFSLFTPMNFAQPDLGKLIKLSPLKNLKTFKIKDIPQALDVNLFAEFIKVSF